MQGWPKTIFDVLDAGGIVVTVLLVAIGGGVWLSVHSWTDRSLKNTPPPAPAGGLAEGSRTDPSSSEDTSTRIVTVSAETDVNGAARGSKSNTARGHAAPETATGGSPIAAGGSPIDFSETSWQNPFTAGHWNSTGWSFSGTMMQSRGDGRAEALFGRSYRKVRLDLSLEAVRPAEPARQPEPREDPATASRRWRFQVRFDAPETGATMTVTFGKSEVVVSADTPKQTGVIKRRKVALPLSLGQRAQLSLIATGNRVRIFSDARPVLACTQPATQSGHDLTFTLISRDGAWRISRLRIEGE